MTTEQLLLERWRDLSSEQQQSVIDFVEFLYARRSDGAPPVTMSVGQSLQLDEIPLRQRLQQLRQQIVESETPLLNEKQLNVEIASRRGGIQS